MDKNSLLNGYYIYLKQNYNYSYQTIKNYLSQINLFLDLHYEEFINANNEEKIKISRIFIVTNESKKKRYKNKCIYNRKYALKFFLMHLGIDQKIITEQFRGISKVGERENIDTITYNELCLLINELTKQGEKEIKLLVTLMYDTGARIRAMMTIKRENIVKTDDGSIIIYITEKGRKKELKYITKNTQVLLEDWLNDIGKRKYLFFENNKITYNDIDSKYVNIWIKLTTISKMLFGKKITSHWIRRGAAVEIYNETKDLITAKTLLGHSSIITTMRYLKAAEVDLKPLIEKKKRDW